jgi:hypothetical protein
MLLCLSRHVLVSPDWTEERPEQERKVGVVDGGWANYEAFLGLTLGVLSTTEFIYYYYYFFSRENVVSRWSKCTLVGYYPWSTQPYGVESKPRAGSLVIFKPQRKNDTTAKKPPSFITACGDRRWRPMVKHLDFHHLDLTGIPNIFTYYSQVTNRWYSTSPSGAYSVA